MPDEHTATEAAAAETAAAHTQASAAGDASPGSAASTETGPGEHAAPDGAPLHPLIDLSRDPTPGKPDHALPEDE